MSNIKPLGIKSYGSIGHLLGSKLGETDRYLNHGQHNICVTKTRDKNDLIIVQEKYDGSNVGVCKVNGQIYPITRAGYIANESNFIQHHVFYDWVIRNKSVFNSILNEGERISGEWLYQVHSLKYDITNNIPFIAFDMFNSHNERFTFELFTERIKHTNIQMPNLLFIGNESLAIDKALCYLDSTNTKEKEGVVYRVERKGKVDFLAKYVLPEFECGIYMRDEIYNIDKNDILDYE